MAHPAKYPSTPHWPWSLQVHKDDRYHDDPDFFVGKEVSITEKLDGGNTLLCAGEVYARSTGQPATQGWFAMVKKHHVWKTAGLPNSLSIFGEDLYGIHSLVYDPMKEDETYRVFNIRDGDRWLSLDNRVALAQSLDLLTVPVLFRGVFKSVKDITRWFNQHIGDKSVLGPNLEGFVLQITDSFSTEEFGQSVCKFIRRDHVQTQDKHWTRNWKPAELIR